MTKIGLVLGAGGSVGLAYHGGVLAALTETTGWDPRDAEIIVGTSAGALSAAMLRGGLSASDLTAISEIVHSPPRALRSELAPPCTDHACRLVSSSASDRRATREP